MVPQKITPGDTLSWSQSKIIGADGSENNSADWDLKYYFRKTTDAGNSSVITVTGTPRNDGGWDFQNAFNSNLAAGDYYYSAQAIKKSDATVKVTVDSGKTKVVPNINSTAAIEMRSQARQDLEAVQAAMRAIISGGAVQEYAVGTRSLKKMTMEDLIKLESKLKVLVVREEKAERIRQGLGNPDNIKVRFSK
jgi:hypothetical protein